MAIVAVGPVAKAVVHRGPEALVQEDIPRALMTPAAIILGGRARMAGEAMPFPPPGGMRIRMGAEQILAVTERALLRITRTRMA